MKKIENYLHLYLGCEVKHKSFVKPFVLKSVSLSGAQIGGHADGDIGYNTIIENFKLLLRPLPSMTEDECLVISKIFGNASHLSEDGQIVQIRELFSNNGYYNKVTNITGNSWNKAVNYCRKQGIDMDGLIDAGLAIDKTTQP